MTATAFAQGIIDVHSHLITSEFVSALENEGRLMDEGFPLPKYDVAQHLEWMDEAGIETSVLTMAAPQPFSKETVRKTNEAAARIKSWMQHLTYHKNVKEGASNEWMEPVTDEIYGNLK